MLYTVAYVGLFEYTKSGEYYCFESKENGVIAMSAKPMKMVYKVAAPKEGRKFPVLSKDRLEAAKRVYANVAGSKQK